MPVIRSSQDDIPGKDSAQQIPLCTVEEGLLYVKARGSGLLLEAIVEDSREVGVPGPAGENQKFGVSHEASHESTDSEIKRRYSC